MTIYAAFWGGSSYSMFDLTNKDDIEKFDTISDAADELRKRHGQYYSCYPVVDDQACMWLFKNNPAYDGGDYPDYIISIGPRGGIQINRHP